MDKRIRRSLYVAYFGVVSIFCGYGNETGVQIRQKFEPNYAGSDVWTLVPVTEAKP